LSVQESFFATYLSWIPRVSDLNEELLERAESVLEQNEYLLQRKRLTTDEISFVVKNPLRYFRLLYTGDLSVLMDEVRKVIPNIEDVTAEITVHSTGFVLIKCKDRLNVALKELARGEISYNLNVLFEKIKQDLSTTLWLWSTKEGVYAMKFEDLHVRRMAPILANQSLAFLEVLFTDFESEVSFLFTHRDFQKIRERIRDFGYSFFVYTTSFLERVTYYLEDQDLQNVRGRLESLQRRVRIFLAHTKEYLDFELSRRE